VPEVKGIVARAGSDELGLDPMGLNQTDTFMVLKPRDELAQARQGLAADKMRAVLADFPGVGYSFTQPIDMRVSEMLTGVRGDLAIKVFGPDLATLNELAGEIENTLRQEGPGRRGRLTVKNDGVQYLRVAGRPPGRRPLRPQRRGHAGRLRVQLEGQRAGTVIDQGRRVPLLLRGRTACAISPADFAALRISAPDGGSVPLASVAKLERVDGPVKVDRENCPALRRGPSPTSAAATWSASSRRQRPPWRARSSCPTGYRLAWGGQFENQQRAAARLMLVVPVALG
jgi:cobalt-zinc-cadmium resistance protein CzcA